MLETKIKWHDYSEINNYCYGAGHMLFQIEYEQTIYQKGYPFVKRKQTVTDYRIGYFTHPDNGNGIVFQGGTIVGMRIIKFALCSEFEDL